MKANTIKKKTRYSRRKYAEAVKCLKAAIRNESLPWVQRLHAIQLLFVIYELPLPEQIAPSTRSLRVVKELIEQRSLERELLRETRTAEEQAIAAEEEREAEQERERLAEQAAIDARAFLERVHSAETQETD